jgi:hypothetical protein
VVAGPNSITGTVTDGAGTPLAGIRLSDSFGATAATSDADGTYLLDGLQPDTEYFVSASDPAGFHTPAFIGPVLVSSIETAVADIVLDDVVVQVVGTITDPLGQPVAGVTVTDSLGFGIFATTGADGRYALSNLPAATFELNVDPSGSRPDLRPTTIVVDVVDGVVADGSVQLQAQAAFVVHVTAAGSPAAGSVSIWRSSPFGWVQGPGAVIGADGTAVVAVPEDGDWLVQVDSATPDFAGEFVPGGGIPEAGTLYTITGDQQVALDVALTPAGVISGTITRPDGSPGNFFDASALAVGGSNSFPTLVGCNLADESAPAGTYRIGCLQPSVDYIVQASGGESADEQFYPDAQSPQRATPVAVEPGVETTGIDFQLHPKTPEPTITGLSQSYFRTGTVTRGVRVYGSFFPSDPNALVFRDFVFGTEFKVTRVISSREAVVDITVAPGTIGEVPVARDILLFRTIGGFGSCGSCMFVGDRTTKVGTITGKVTDNRDRGVGGAQVRLTSLDGTTVHTVGTAADGSYTAAGLVPGKYTVHFEGTEALNPQYWRRQTSATAATPVTVSTGKTTKDISAKLARRGPITITGAVQTEVPTSFDLDLVGTGLSSIEDGFRVSIAGPFGPQVLTATSVSSTNLRVSGFTFPGVYDVTVTWTADNGTLRSTVCSGCLNVV